MDHENTLKANLLGSFTLEYQNKVLQEVLTDDSLSWQILKFLLVNHNRVVTLSEMKLRFLKNRTLKNPDNAMRVHLKRVRYILDRIGLGDSANGLVIYQRENYFINPSITVRLDTEEVTALTKAVLSEKEALPERQRKCDAALELYKGVYLAKEAGCDWVVFGRVLTANFFADLLEFKIHNSGKEHPELTDELCQRALSIAPENDSLHRTIIYALLEAGRGVEARAYYAALGQQQYISGRIPADLNAYLAV